MMTPKPKQLEELARLAHAAIAADVDLDTLDLCEPGADAPEAAVASYQAESDRLALVDRVAREKLRRAFYRCLGGGEAALVLEDGSVVAIVDQSDGLGLIPPGRVLRVAGAGRVEFSDSIDPAHPAGLGDKTREEGIPGEDSR